MSDPEHVRRHRDAARGRGDRAGRDRAGAPHGDGAAARAARSRRSTSCARSSRPSTRRRAAASSSRGSRAATGSRPTPTRTRTSNGSCSTARPRGLSGPALETLAIIAYKQPVSRAQLSAIRGVNVDATLKTLVARGYVDEIGHDPTPGNPSMFATSRLVPRTARPQLARPTCPRSPTSCPRRRSSKRSNAVCCSRRRTSTPSRSHRPSRSPRSSSRASSSPVGDEGERLQKVLARAGVGSRRTNEMLIAEGRVTVNGEVAVLGRRVDPEHDRVALDGVPVVVDADPRALAAQQARGLRHDRARHARPADGARSRARRAAGVPGRPSRPRHRGSPVADERRRSRAAAHAPEPRRGEGVLRRGRGQADAGRAAHAARRVSTLDDGPTRPAQAKILQESASGTTALTIVVKEGRKRMVRRMCAAVGHPVVRLARTRIGPLRDPHLAPGTWRALSADEVRALYARGARRRRRAARVT